MEALECTNRSGLSNSQIKDRTGLPAETVARVLKVLREEGRVTSRKVGRFTINRPTSRLRGLGLHMRGKALVEQFEQSMYGEKEVTPNRFLRVREKDTAAHLGRSPIHSTIEASASKLHVTVTPFTSEDSPSPTERKIGQRPLAAPTDKEIPRMALGTPKLMNEPRITLEPERA